MTDITELGRSRTKIQTQAVCLAPESILLAKALYCPVGNVFPLPGKDPRVAAAQQTLVKWSVKQLDRRRVEDGVA